MGDSAPTSLVSARTFVMCMCMPSSRVAHLSALALRS
jgi:hypothetical protein